VACQKFKDVSAERVVSIFTAEEQAYSSTLKIEATCSTETIRKLLSDYMASNLHFHIYPEERCSTSVKF
jgi:hypothetical protein